MQIVLYIWATVAITLFTLAFIFSYEIDSGYRHTLQVAALTLGWPLVLPAIVLVFAIVTFLEFRRAGRHLAASRPRAATRARLTEKVGPADRGDPAKGADTGVLRRWSGATRAYR